MHATTLSRWTRTDRPAAPVCRSTRGSPVKKKSERVQTFEELQWAGGDGAVVGLHGARRHLRIAGAPADHCRSRGSRWRWSAWPSCSDSAAVALIGVMEVLGMIVLGGSRGQRRDPARSMRRGARSAGGLPRSPKRWRGPPALASAPDRDDHRDDGAGPAAPGDRSSGEAARLRSPLALTIIGGLDRLDAGLPARDPLSSIC